MVWQPDYVTVAELKSFLRIEPGDTADDVFLARWITAASRSIDDATGRQFGLTDSETRYYDQGAYDRRSGRWFVDVDDIPDPDAVTVLDANGNTVDVTLLPRNAAARGRPYEQLRLDAWDGGELAVTSPFGWSDVPGSVPAAIDMQANRLAARRDSPFGIAGSPSDGSEIRLLARLDPDVELTLRPVTRKWWAR